MNKKNVGKGKAHQNRPRKPRGEEEELYTFLTLAPDGVVGQRHVPPPSKKARYPLCRKLGGPQDRSGQVRKISLPPIFDPRTVRPVASCYTD